MIHHPPKCSASWTDAERIALAAWICRTVIARMDRGSPAENVMVVKAPMRVLFDSVREVLELPAEELEKVRAVLETPYDDSKDTVTLAWKPTREEHS